MLMPTLPQKSCQGCDNWQVSMSGWRWRWSGTKLTITQNTMEGLHKQRLQYWDRGWLWALRLFCKLFHEWFCKLLCHSYSSHSWTGESIGDNASNTATVNKWKKHWLAKVVCMGVERRRQRQQYRQEKCGTRGKRRRKKSLWSSKKNFSSVNATLEEGRTPDLQHVRLAL